MWPATMLWRRFVTKYLKCLGVLVVLVAGLATGTGCSKAIQGAQMSAYNR